MSLQGVEIPLLRIHEYRPIVEQWLNQANINASILCNLNNTDREIVRNSRRVIQCLLQRFNYPSSDYKFFAAIDSQTKRVYTFAVAKFSLLCEADLLTLASDPNNLSITHWKSKRIKGGGTEVIRTIAKKVLRLRVIPDPSAEEFYRKVGFRYVTQSFNDIFPSMVLDVPHLTKSSS